MRCCHAGHAKQVGHCVQLKHGSTTWQVRKPNTIRLDAAIQEFMQHQAKASPDGRQYQALLPDGSLVDTSLTIAALALTPEDTVEVRWSAQAEGVHMSVRSEGRGASEAGQHKKGGNRMAQSSTRSSAVAASAVPHTAAAADPTAAPSAPFVAAAVPTAAASVPKAVQPVPAAAKKGELCIFFCPQTCFCWQLQNRTMRQAVLQPVPDACQCHAGVSAHDALCCSLSCLFLPPMPVTLCILLIVFHHVALLVNQGSPCACSKSSLPNLCNMWTDGLSILQAVEMQHMRTQGTPSSCGIKT